MGQLPTYKKNRAATKHSKILAKSWLSGTTVEPKHPVPSRVARSHCVSAVASLAKRRNPDAAKMGGTSDSSRDKNGCLTMQKSASPCLMGLVRELVTAFGAGSDIFMLPAGRLR